MSGISNLLPVIAGGNSAFGAPTTRRGGVPDSTESKNSNVVRFLFEAPLQNNSTPFDQTENSKNVYDAVTQTESFSLLLAEQQNNGSARSAASSPFENAVNAYAAAEDTARYARPQETLLGIL